MNRTFASRLRMILPFPFRRGDGRGEGAFSGFMVRVEKKSKLPMNHARRIALRTPLTAVDSPLPF